MFIADITVYYWRRVPANCVFDGNSANDGGVASWILARFQGCTFSNNHAVVGGVLNQPVSDSPIEGYTFLNNSAPYGSVFAQMSLATISNCVFARNDSGPLFYDVDASFDHCTFYGNEGTFANAEIVYLFPWNWPTFNSCLFAYNEMEMAYCPSGIEPFWGRLYLENCIVFQTSTLHPSCFTPDPAHGYIVANPHFCDTSGTDFSVAANSPCIGQGSDGTNIGAYGIGCVATSIGDEGSQGPLEFDLSQNRPNPFNPSTTISFDLPRAEEVTLVIYNLLGQEVARLLDHQRFGAGRHEVSWDAPNAASGVYLYRLETPAYTSSRKMVVLK